MPTVVSYTSILHAYAKQGDIQARHLNDEDDVDVDVVVVVVPSDPSFARIFSDVLRNGNRVFMCISHWACGFVYLEAGVVFAHVLCTE